MGNIFFTSLDVSIITKQIVFIFIIIALQFLIIAFNFIILLAFSIFLQFLSMIFMHIFLLSFFLLVISKVLALSFLYFLIIFGILWETKIAIFCHCSEKQIKFYKAGVKMLAF